jgi:hypothetical protein
VRTNLYSRPDPEPVAVVAVGPVYLTETKAGRGCTFDIELAFVMPAVENDPAFARTELDCWQAHGIGVTPHRTVD